MNAAAPGGTPPRRISNEKNTINLFVPPCLKRGPEAGLFVYCTIFIVWVRTFLFMTVSPEPKKSIFLMDFVLIALCGFPSVYTEILIGEPEFPCNRTCPAGAPYIF